jgi:hypothetical protein
MQLNLPIDYVGADNFNAFGTGGTVVGSARESNNVYTQKLQAYALDRQLTKYAKKYKDFAVRAIVVPTPDSKKPSTMRPGAYIGSKEGLKIDQKYHAYIRIERKDGTSFYRRKATLRADRITENRTFREQSNQKSRFYYDSGFNVRNGALIRQAPDLGIGFNGYISNLDLGDWGLRIDYNLSQFGRKAKPQFRFNVNYSRMKFDSVETFTKSNVLFYGIGISRQFNFSKNIKWEPHVSLNWTKLNYERSINASPLAIDDTDAGWELGLRVLLNVAPQARIFIDGSSKQTGFENYGLPGATFVYSFGFRYCI